MDREVGSEVAVGYVVASAALHDLLRAAPRPARVVAVLPVAAYLESTDPVDGRPRLVALLTRDAVRVPIGLVTAHRREAEPFAAVRAGDPASIGDGELRIAGSVHRPLRYWDPRVPRLRARLVSAEALNRAEALAVLAAGLPDEDVARWAALGAGLGAALAEPAAPGAPAGALRAAVEGLAGLGPGLTPAGDDVLAGALVALAAAGEDGRRRLLAAEVERVLSRTTPVSAALLEQAAHGRTVPELAGLLRALAGSGDLRAAVDALTRVGHTSGAAHALGVRVAVGPSAADIWGGWRDASR